MFIMLTPSISIVPLSLSFILNMAYKMELLPAPVLPTIPTFDFDFIVNDTFLRAGSKSSLYLIVMLEKIIYPSDPKELFSNFTSIDF